MELKVTCPTSASSALPIGVPHDTRRVFPGDGRPPPTPLRGNAWSIWRKWWISSKVFINHHIIDYTWEIVWTLMNFDQSQPALKWRVLSVSWARKITNREDTPPYSTARFSRDLLSLDAAFSRNIWSSIGNYMQLLTRILKHREGTHLVSIPTSVSWWKLR